VPPHIAFAIAELGTLEVAGDGDNPRIREYHSATAAGAAPDAVHWCSSFGNWCFLQSGVIGTRSKAARSWLKPPPGFELVNDEPRLGDVVVLSSSRGPAAGHFTFWLGRAGATAFYGLGGNQANQVNVGRYQRARIVGVVRHVGASSPV
jgi:uncharacterized protein (TIGR02594 family)